jgi:hypothetical protein
LCFICLCAGFLISTCVVKPAGSEIHTELNRIIIIIIIIIITTTIIIIIIAFMQGIHTYTPETNHVSRVYSVAATPRLLLMVHIALSAILNSLVFIIIIIIITRSRALLAQQITPHSTEPEKLLSCLQEPASCPFRKPNDCSPQPSIHFQRTCRSRVR